MQQDEAKWYNIATCLKLKPKVLETIKSEASSSTEAMAKVIDNWLQMDYDVEEFGPPTWKALVEAVEAPDGGNNSALAEEIAVQHSALGKLTRTINGGQRRPWLIY